MRPKISDKDCPGPLLDLMKRCWARSPQDRPTFGEIIREMEQMNFKGLPADK